MSSIKLPRVVAVHALAGFGKCSLTVAIPVLSACGVEVMPLPTAILSTNTGFPGFVINPYTDHMESHAEHWKKIDCKVDALYSGFLSSEKQIEIVQKIKQDFSPSLTVIDPVMGDNGVKYKTFTDTMCKKLAQLVSVADVATPNLTEGCILTNTPYGDGRFNQEEIKAICLGIQGLGAKNVVVTGIEEEEQLGVAVLKEDGTFAMLYCPKLPINMFGTGDTFASVLTGKLLTGSSLLDAVEQAMDFVLQAMEFSYTVEDYAVRGVCFEPVLHKLRK